MSLSTVDNNHNRILLIKEINPSKVPPPPNFSVISLSYSIPSGSLRMTFLYLQHSHIAATVACPHKPCIMFFSLFVLGPSFGKPCAGNQVKEEVPSTAQAEPGPESAWTLQIPPQCLPFSSHRVGLDIQCTVVCLRCSVPKTPNTPSCPCWNHQNN